MIDDKDGVIKFKAANAACGGPRLSKWRDCVCYTGAAVACSQGTIPGANGLDKEVR
jgi:hypothetical protein